MDFVNILLFCFMSCVIGAVVMLLIQYYAFVRYFDPNSEQEKKDEENRSADHQRFELPVEVLQNIKLPDADGKSPTIAINLVLQFLFYELRYRTDVRKWFYRKLSLELDDLLTKTTGKLFDKLSLRDLDIGGQFPDIKNLRVHNVELHDEGFIENLDLILNLHYEGNFRMAIEADMLLGKKGFLSVIVKRVSGIMRLQFTRKPYTHWSLSFVGDPEIELGIESQFQGRQMQSNLTSLISNQIRKAIRRKHTLPNYKLRYKPFFHHRTDEDDSSDVIPEGALEVHVVQAARLILPENQSIPRIYCTVALSSIPWITAKNGVEANTITISLLVEIHKTKNQQIGIVFKQLEEAVVIIEAILPNTPAAKANLRRNDILYSVEGKPVSHINQVAKILKAIHKPMFMLRIQRTCPGRIQSDKVASMSTGSGGAAAAEKPSVEKGSTENLGISFSKASESVQLLSATKGASGSCESSQANTPSSSPRKSSLLSRSKSRSLTRNDSEGADSGSTTSINKSEGKEEKNASRIGSMESVREEDHEGELVVQHFSKEFLFNSLIHVGDSSQFNLSEGSKYLNLNVLARTADSPEDILLGYCNIPIGSILSECSESNLRNYLKKFSLQPPDCPNWSYSNLSSLSGFDPNFCYGDLLISFVWNGSSKGLLYADAGASSTKKYRPREASVDVQQPTKQHEFARKHFNRTTQCDFCGKKIWLKDAVQCTACQMCCHKKCINKCQNSTVCGSAADPNSLASSSSSSSFAANPEFKVTEVGDSNAMESCNSEDSLEAPNPGEGHRASLGDFLAQGLKRVNSANNLAIPAIVASLSSSSGGGQGTKSLPPSPQLTPRKQSLASPSKSPFMIVAARLAALEDASQIDEEDIMQITEPLLGMGSPDDMMSHAKAASNYLYEDLEPNERLDKINGLLSKLRLALDFETSNHADLTANANELRQHREKPVEALRLGGGDSTILLQTKSSSESPHGARSDLEAKIARCAFLLGQSEERVQALSVIMLYLCSGMQFAQGSVQ